MNKIKNAVPAGVHPRDQVRPRHRTLRWDTSGEQTKGSLRGEQRKIRHLAFSHELFQELRVHAVDAEND